MFSNLKIIVWCVSNLKTYFLPITYDQTPTTNEKPSPEISPTRIGKRQELIHDEINISLHAPI